MRSFVVFSALFAVGLCGLLPGGYNYNSGSTFNHNAVVGPAFAGSNNVPQVSGGIQAPAYTSSGNVGAPSIQQPSFSGNGVSGVSGFPGNSGASGFPGNSGSSGFPGAGSIQSPVGAPSVGAPVFQQSGAGFPAEAPVAHHEAPLITKQFYLHSAPEDHDSLQKSKHFVLGRAQKNYRVVFIKAPSSSNANVHLSAEYAPQEEKTVIYVLSQKEHELDVNDIATPAPTQPSKPEVFFIKYKTPEEAAHAQQEIQKQYDVLGGQSQVSDEGHAPVSDVSGALTPAASNTQSNIGYLPPSNTNTNQQYLPPQH